MTPDKDKEYRFDCKAHSGIRAEIDKLSESDEKQWDFIERLQTSKASSSQMRWVIGIFLIIAMATVGFLWRAQVSSTETIIKKIEVGDSKLNTLTERFNELKWSVDGLNKQ